MDGWMDKPCYLGWVERHPVPGVRALSFYCFSDCLCFEVSSEVSLWGPFPVSRMCPGEPRLQLFLFYLGPIQAELVPYEPPHRSQGVWLDLLLLLGLVTRSL